jgi:hypothetical protein
MSYCNFINIDFSPKPLALRQRFNNVYILIYINVIVRGRIVWGRIVFGKNCSWEKLLLGRIALGKNCRERIVWGRIYLEELIIYAMEYRVKNEKELF